MVRGEFSAGHSQETIAFPALQFSGDSPSGPDVRSNRTFRTFTPVLVCVVDFVRPLHPSRHCAAIGARRRERGAAAIRIVAQRCASVRRAAVLADIDSRGPGLDVMALHGGGRRATTCQGHACARTGDRVPADDGRAARAGRDRAQSRAVVCESAANGVSHGSRDVPAGLWPIPLSPWRIGPIMIS